MILEEAELMAKGIRAHKVAIQARIDDFVPGGQDTVISQHSEFGPGQTTNISGLRKARINDVLQQWTDQSHASITAALLTRHSYKRRRLGKFSSQSARSATIA